MANTHSRTDLNIIHMYVQETVLNIRCGKPKIGRKMDISKRVACNSHDPYEINYGEVERTIEFPDIDQSQRGIFERIMERQETGKMKHMPTCTVYKYDKTGKLVKDYHLKKLWIEEISQEGNEPFTAKGGFLMQVKD